MFECDTSGRKVMRRPWVRLAVAGALLFGPLATFQVFWMAPMQAHRDWSNRVRADLDALGRKRPAGVTSGQWEHAVGWTRNLHANCGVMHTWVDRGWREGFAADLEARLQGPVGTADIDWIWNEYAAHTDGGKQYSDLFRARMWEGFREIDSPDPGPGAK